MIGATLVIYGHSSPLVGTGELFPPEWALQPDEGVLMGFFALSGFQITESWRRDPHPARFAAKRVLRLWPPMLTVSFGMALVIGPLVTTLPMGEYFSAKDTWGYIVNNAGLLTLQHDLPGVFSNNPWPDAVNGSLWTLPMELLAYTGLYVLLLLGAAKHNRRWLAVIALVALVLWDRHLEHAPGAESAGSLLSVPVESLVAFHEATNRFGVGLIDGAIAEAARRELARIRRGVSEPPSVMVSAWHPPLRWFIGFLPEDSVEPMVLRSGLARVRDRVSAAVAAMRRAELPELWVEDMANLAQWLEAFGAVGMVELDYREVGWRLGSTLIDDTTFDVASAVDALLEGDIERSTRMYGSAMFRWAEAQAVAYSS